MSTNADSLNTILKNGLDNPIQQPVKKTGQLLATFTHNDSEAVLETFINEFQKQFSKKLEILEILNCVWEQTITFDSKFSQSLENRIREITEICLKSSDIVFLQNWTIRLLNWSKTWTEKCLDVCYLIEKTNFRILELGEVKIVNGNKSFSTYFRYPIEGLLENYLTCKIYRILKKHKSASEMLKQTEKRLEKIEVDKPEQEFEVLKHMKEEVEELKKTILECCEEYYNLIFEVFDLEVVNK